MNFKCPEASIQITTKRRPILLVVVKNLQCFISDFEIIEKGEVTLDKGVKYVLS